jgi:hypothetical protein
MEQTQAGQILLEPFSFAPAVPFLPKSMQRCTGKHLRVTTANLSSTQQASRWLKTTAGAPVNAARVV